LKSRIISTALLCLPVALLVGYSGYILWVLEGRPARPEDFSTLFSFLEQNGSIIGGVLFLGYGMLFAIRALRWRSELTAKQLLIGGAATGALIATLTLPVNIVVWAVDGTFANVISRSQANGFSREAAILSILIGVFVGFLPRVVLNTIVSMIGVVPVMLWAQNKRVSSRPPAVRREN
jgi:hypothetical protein